MEQQNNAPKGSDTANPVRGEETYSNQPKSSNEKKNSKKKDRLGKAFGVISTVVYLVVLIASNSFATPLNPIASTVNRVYDVPASVIALTYSLWNLAGVVGGMPANYVVNKLGIRYSIIICYCFAVAGLFLRMFINQNFWLFLLGCAVGGFGSPFGGNFYPVFCAEWYHNRLVRIEFKKNYLLGYSKDNKFVNLNFCSFLFCCNSTSKIKNKIFKESKGAIFSQIISNWFD